MQAKRILTLDKVALEIDLEKLFGKKIVDPALRRNIAEDLISIIEDRTLSGNGVNGNGSEVKLKSPYSDEYIKSPEFKAFGKDKKKVNMKLTGSMLASVDLIGDHSSKIQIGIENEDAPKAYNHMTGDTVPVRPFLGLTSKDLDKIKQEYSKDVGADTAITVADIFNRNDLARLANIVSNKKIIGFEP